MEKEKMINIQEWKSNKKGKLIHTVKELILSRSSYRCDHAERRFDDDICAICFAKMIVEKFEETI